MTNVLRPITTNDIDFMIALVSDSETTRYLPGMISDRKMMEVWILSLGESDNQGIRQSWDGS